ncbi:TPA: Arc family DNA-binding protein [Pseudomonas aeruginosa]|uniref:Arc family DNA-binding protein n=1 Tax=Pseudomonas aeruginosa TaxID=287 RepID=UPI0028762E8C|nr:Arc family DNA-binding protein [Pseudomonas aeruginosa]MDS1043972.1 Arc family DNA-binding protein [Pseudomonas aeruginosa]HBO4037773.1 Arc family DNA-binding protein [Pseudomonas aeruginosa]HCF1395409.1 Arc family DNA-binding protein [Pseudomonas aeruginosa]HCR1671167.1 Arc family DNA-binding protein [Pseudomonas aeruginosa]
MKRATVVTELPASTSRDMDKFVVRLPDGLRAEVEAEAKRDERSMNSVVIIALREYLHGQQQKRALLKALTKAAGSN